MATPRAGTKPLSTAPGGPSEERTGVTIPAELEAQILRYFHVEKWRVGTIATQLGVHHATVDRVLSQAGLPKSARAHRASLFDPYLAFVANTLEHYPRLTASRLYAMVRERGSTGVPITSAIRSPCSARAPNPRPICA